MLRQIPSFIALLGLLVIDVVYVRWAWLGEAPQADVPARVAIGVILALLTVLVVMAFVRWIAAALKGDLRIALPNRAFNLGEVITGEILLTASQRLQLEGISMTLTAAREIYRGNDKSRRWEIVYSNTQVLTGPRELLPDLHRFPLQVTLPEMPPAPQPQAWPEGWETVQKVAIGVGKILNPRGLGPVLRWTLEVRAELPGVDLSEEKILSINQGFVNDPS